MLSKLLKKSASSVLTSFRPSTCPEGTPRSFTRCGLAWDKARLGAPGLGGWKSGPFETPAGLFSSCRIWADHRRSNVPKWFFAACHTRHNQRAIGQVLAQGQAASWRSRIAPPGSDSVPVSCRKPDLLSVKTDRLPRDRQEKEGVCLRVSRDRLYWHSGHQPIGSVRWSLVQWR